MVSHLFQHSGSAWLARLYLRCRFRFAIVGLAHAHDAINHGKGVLLAGNHTGLLDSILVTAAYPGPVTFLMREEVTKWPWVGWLVKRANTIILWQAQMTRQLRHSIERLKQGDTLVIFPEGELTKTGELGSFNDGVGLLWHKSEATLLPFVIHGGYTAWKEGEWHANGGVKLVIEFLPPWPCDPAKRKTLPDTLKHQIQQALVRGPGHLPVPRQD
jgi:1-acyl-sn-glycerol-3-phosphate acyltransferase